MGQFLGTETARIFQFLGPDLKCWAKDTVSYVHIIDGGLVHVLDHVVLSGPSRNLKRFNPSTFKP